MGRTRRTTGQRWRAPTGAILVTGTALACSTVAYRSFRSALGSDAFAAAYAFALAAGICGFIGLVAIAILLSSRFTREAARDPLWSAFKVFAALAFAGLSLVTGASLTPWSWWSFATGLAFSIIVNSGWAVFLVMFIQERRPPAQAPID